MPQTKSRGRKRSAESEEAILTATLELLGEKPLRDITIEGIAHKAGVGKVTIYKWWPSKAFVALDAYKRIIEHNIPIADTGDVMRDLANLLRSSMKLSVNPHGKIFGQFVSEAHDNPEFAVLFRDYFLKPRRDAIVQLLDRAVKRGEIDSTFEREFVLDLLFGPLIFRMMVGYGPPTMKADSIIAAMLCGISSKESHQVALSRTNAAKKRPLTKKKLSGAKS